jgi:hypothetical protein
MARKLLLMLPLDRGTLPALAQPKLTNVPESGGSEAPQDAPKCGSEGKALAFARDALIYAHF